MSKSKGNTVDPLGLIDQYGADALRFTLAAMESQGRDIKLDEKRVEGYRNFATKLWNAARFLQMNGVGASQSTAAPAAELPVNRWIIGEVVETLARLDKAFAELRFDDMADAIYHFTWGTFCDWYVELIKGALAPNSVRPEPVEGLSSTADADDESAVLRQAQDERQEETKRVAAWAFDQILVMLHPFMPFVTEELWHAMGERPYDLIVAKWPAPEAQVDQVAKDDMDWLIGLVFEIRSARQELNVPPAAKPVLLILDQSEQAERVRYRMHGALKRLARIETQVSFDKGAGLPSPEQTQRIDERVFDNRARKGAVQIPARGLTAELLLEGVIDLDAEKARLSKAAEAAEKDRDSLAARLANPAFAERAKPEAVDKARADHDARAAEAERLRAALARLG
jgi:valyl-tRNA synthetase